MIHCELWTLYFQFDVITFQIWTPPSHVLEPIWIVWIVGNLCTQSIMTEIHVTDALCESLKLIFVIYHRKNAPTSVNTLHTDRCSGSFSLNYLKRHSFIALLFSKRGLQFSSNQYKRSCFIRSFPATLQLRDEKASSESYWLTICWEES